MRSVHKTTAVVAALGIAFGLTACGGADESGAPVKKAPRATATTTTPTPMVTATAVPVPKASPAPTATLRVPPMPVDTSLKMDLKNMATMQEIWITDHVTSGGVAVTATKPGGTAKLGGSTFHASVGNVIAVKVYQATYCISGYNKAATKASSATKSLLYKSDKGGLQDVVGTCPKAGTLAGVDASLQLDLKNMATMQETWLTDHVTSGGFAVAATKPGGTAMVGTTPGTRNVFQASVGNVIAVKVFNGMYCVSAYNEAATKATSAIKSLLYRADKGGIQAGVGTC